MSSNASAAQSAPAAKPILQGPKRQHFLPKFYLEGFADDDGMVAVFDRSEKEIRIQHPINTGVIGHFYTYTDDQGRQRFELEQWLSEYEGKASSTIKKLVAKEEITPDERAEMAIFIALAGFRTPDIVDSLKQANASFIDRFAKMQFQNSTQVAEQMRGKPDAPASEEELQKQAQEMVDFVQGGQYKITTDHRWAVGVAISQALNIAPILAGRDWDVLHSNNDKKSFVTSDAPVVLSTVAPRPPSIWGVGFGNSDALVIFPLTAATALVIYGNDGGFRHLPANAEQIRHFNLMVADRCQRFVIGRDAALVKSLTEFLKLVDKKWAPKMQAS
jgi:hypothetical protein